MKCILTFYYLKTETIGKGFFFPNTESPQSTLNI